MREEETYLIDEVLAMIIGEGLGPDDSVPISQLGRYANHIAHRSVSINSCRSVTVTVSAQLTSAHLYKIDLCEIRITTWDNDIKD
jgi:hypothetical protein